MLVLFHRAPIDFRLYVDVVTDRDPRAGSLDLAGHLRLPIFDSATTLEP